MCKRSFLVPLMLAIPVLTICQEARWPRNEVTVSAAFVQPATLGHGFRQDSPTAFAVEYSFSVTNRWAVASSFATWRQQYDGLWSPFYENSISFPVNNICVSAQYRFLDNGKVALYAGLGLSFLSYGTSGNATDFVGSGGPYYYYLGNKTGSNVGGTAGVGAKFYVGKHFFLSLTVSYISNKIELVHWAPMYAGGRFIGFYAIGPEKYSYQPVSYLAGAGVRW